MPARAVRLRLSARMSSRTRLLIAFAAIALALVAVAGGSQVGELAGRYGPGQHVLDPGFVAVSFQPVGIEASPNSRRTSALNRPRRIGGAMPLAALAAMGALLHLWSLLRIEPRARRAGQSPGWTLAPRAPPRS